MSADDLGTGPAEGQWVCPECGRRVTRQLDTCPYCERGRQPAASRAPAEPAATPPPVAPAAALPPPTSGKSRRSCVVIAVLVLLAACFLTAAGGALYVVFTQPGAQLMGTVVAYFISPTPTATATPTATPTPVPTRTPTPIPIPQACGMTLADVTFAPIRVGTLVILGRHRAVDGDTNWVSSMDQYVGRQARVARLAGTDTAGCPVVTVDVDDGQFYWRIRDMTIIE